MIVFKIQTVLPGINSIFVQNGDAAHNSSRRQVIDFTYTRQAPKKSTSHGSTAQMDLPHARCYLLVVLLGGIFFNVVVLSACWLCSWLCS